MSTTSSTGTLISSSIKHQKVCVSTPTETADTHSNINNWQQNDIPTDVLCVVLQFIDPISWGTFRRIRTRWNTVALKYSNKYWKRYINIDADIIAHKSHMNGNDDVTGIIKDDSHYEQCRYETTKYIIQNNVSSPFQQFVQFPHCRNRPWQLCASSDWSSLECIIHKFGVWHAMADSHVCMFDMFNLKSSDEMGTTGENDWPYLPSSTISTIFVRSILTGDYQRYRYPLTAIRPNWPPFSADAPNAQQIRVFRRFVEWRVQTELNIIVLSGEDAEFMNNNGRNFDNVLNLVMRSVIRRVYTGRRKKQDIRDYHTYTYLYDDVHCTSLQTVKRAVSFLQLPGAEQLLKNADHAIDWIDMYDNYSANYRDAMRCLQVKTGIRGYQLVHLFRYFGITQDVLLCQWYSNAEQSRIPAQVLCQMFQTMSRTMQTTTSTMMHISQDSMTKKLTLLDILCKFENVIPWITKD